MLRRLAFGLTAAALMGGCAHAGDKGLQWFGDEAAPEGAKLTLGAPETDDVRLMLICRPRSGIVELTVVGRREDGAVIELRSGKVTSRHPGAGFADEETDGAFDVRASIPADDPALLRFADTGQLVAVLGDRKIKAPNGFALGHDFLRVCRR